MQTPNLTSKKAKASRMKDETPLYDFDTIDLNHYNTFLAWKDKECMLTDFRFVLHNCC